MLGKQWLNKYDSIDLRGSAIERSRDRQRKLNGIKAWYFDQVIGSLPVMLQAALLLLGCALSKYLWEIHTTVAAVVIGAFSLSLRGRLPSTARIKLRCQTWFAQFLAYSAQSPVYSALSLVYSVQFPAYSAQSPADSTQFPAYFA